MSYCTKLYCVELLDKMKIEDYFDESLVCEESADAIPMTEIIALEGRDIENNNSLDDEMRFSQDEGIEEFNTRTMNIIPTKKFETQWKAISKTANLLRVITFKVWSDYCSETRSLDINKAVSLLSKSIDVYNQAAESREWYQAVINGDIDRVIPISMLSDITYTASKTWWQSITENARGNNGISPILEEPWEFSILHSTHRKEFEKYYCFKIAQVKSEVPFQERKHVKTRARKGLNDLETESILKKRKFAAPTFLKMDTQYEEAMNGVKKAALEISQATLAMLSQISNQLKELKAERSFVRGNPYNEMYQTPMMGGSTSSNSTSSSSNSRMKAIEY